MCEAKFTKGDWKVHSVGSQFAVGPLSNSGDQSYGMMNVVAWVEKFDFYDEKQAGLNAHLISTAPEMYDMLEYVMKCAAMQDNLTIDANEISKLLAKARGEHV